MRPLSAHISPALERLTLATMCWHARWLSRRADLPMPKVYVIDEDQPNAFATGRSPEHAAVAVNSGLLNHLSREQVIGVLSHELGHVRNRDTLTMTVAATLAGAIGMLANMAMFTSYSNSDNRSNPLGPVAAILLMVLAPIAATEAGDSSLSRLRVDIVALRGRPSCSSHDSES